MRWVHFKIPYSATADARKALEEMGLKTADTGHGGVTVWHGQGRPGAMVKISSYNRCTVLVTDDKAQDFAARCALAERESF